MPRRVASGDDIRNVSLDVAGIASRLALEAARRDARVAPLEDHDASSDRFEDDVAERLVSLDRCLGQLPEGARALLLRYHATGAERIAGRKRLADELGIALNALRIRMHRLRVTLEACLGPPSTKGSGPRGRDEVT